MKQGKGKGCDDANVFFGVRLANDGKIRQQKENQSKKNDKVEDR